VESIARLNCQEGCALKKDVFGVVGGEPADPIKGISLTTIIHT